MRGDPKPSGPWGGKDVDAFVGARGTHEGGVALRLENSHEELKRLVPVSTGESPAPSLYASWSEGRCGWGEGGTMLVDRR